MKKLHISTQAPVLLILDADRGGQDDPTTQEVAHDRGQFMGANQLLTKQAQSEVGTARRAVRGRLGEPSLPEADLRPQFIRAGF